MVGCLTSRQHASVSQGRICSDNFTCCHTEIEVADQNFYLTQSKYTDTEPTGPSADPIMPDAWQGSHWRSRRKRDSNPESSAPEVDALTTRPARRSALRTVFNKQSHLAKAQLRATHVQHVARYVVQWKRSAITFNRVRIAFVSSFIQRLKPLTTKDGRKPKYPEKTPDEKFRKTSACLGAVCRLHRTRRRL